MTLPVVYRKKRFRKFPFGIRELFKEGIVVFIPKDSELGDKGLFQIADLVNDEKNKNKLSNAPKLRYEIMEVCEKFGYLENLKKNKKG
ncbi:hypothetical protein HY500_03615 [Candidatus Woesearchaeota archaeon]|nr:hypothetical protein [Candidatus Woesearchaeota archaeon]